MEKKIKNIVFGLAHGLIGFQGREVSDAAAAAASSTPLPQLCRAASAAVTATSIRDAAAAATTSIRDAAAISIGHAATSSALPPLLSPWRW
jgi:hypothetical protein